MYANAVAVVGPVSGGSMSSRPLDETVHDTVTVTCPPGVNADVSTCTWGAEQDEPSTSIGGADRFGRGDRS